MITANDFHLARILIVDDQEANVILLERTLQAAGYLAVSSTRDPTRVSAMHRDEHFDLIILDIQMPVMDGFQVMDSLRTLEADGYLPVLAVTAQPAHKLRALEHGAKDFISKPFELAEMLMRVHNMLEVRLLHEAARNHAKMLEELALNDPLTGLANRRLLADRLMMAMANARRMKTAMALVYLDLDGFKEINDTLGHSVGDVLLTMVAQRLVAAVREDDTVARLGGDEFMIALWPVVDRKYLEAVATRVLASVSQPYGIDGHTVNVTTSAGIATFPGDGEDAEALMKSADLALYAAKHAGKNVFRVSEHAVLPVQGTHEPERRIEYRG